MMYAKGTRVIQNKGRPEYELHGTIIECKGKQYYSHDKSIYDYLYVIQWDELKSHPDKGLREWCECHIMDELTVINLLPEDMFKI